MSCAVVHGDDWRTHEDGNIVKANGGEYMIAQCEKMIVEMERAAE